jgi:uncharacterized membrane protein YkvA (DUF1232 family)
MGLILTLRKRAKQIAKPYIAQYKRAPRWVKAVTIACIVWMLIPDFFDLIPGLAYLDELLAATLMLKLLHKYGALPDEDKKTPRDLIMEILGKENK